MVALVAHGNPVLPRLFAVDEHNAIDSALRVESSPPAYGGVISIEAEKTVSLTCLLESSSLVDRELQWFRNGAQIHLQEWNRLNQSSLCLNPVSQDDDGVTFKCQLNSNAAANASVQLEVFFAPDLSGVDNITIEEGGKISLACDIYANPQVTVTWKQNDKALDLASGGYELFHNTWESRLSISKVQREIHEGQYSCVVTSPKFGIRTKIFSLTVEDRTVTFPLGAVIAGVVVVFCTLLLAFISRWKRITKCCK
ncbi:transmembrane and immunoglobulin domain-containing protein 1 [Scleropages formosus]|uniref:transmembrane and immunoglobulin domain-containing protein 1 n=1 Tax=Scleropages formosus TaxID=113540 RepID=UPI000878F2F4|nr:transmembrane and immunoglobulin domain-containing protein 1 [Scleropages formosus]